VTFLLIPFYTKLQSGNNVLPQNGFFLELSGKEQHQLQIISIVFLTDGILLKSGKALKADIIITTGLDLLAFGGVKIQLDSAI
jgi:hypothetical protein